MIKRITAMLLCLLMTVSVFASCTVVKEDEDDKGAIINMYLTQEVYDFDPAYSMKNDSTQQISSLLFSGLFKINEKGKVEKDLVDEYRIDESKNSMIIKIREDASWSDGTYVSANDVVFSFKRILDPEFTCDAASLLFDIKNARTIKNATSDLYVDDIGVFPVGEREVEITFEKDFKDYDGFIENLASPVLVPLREDIVSVNEGDWAKKPGTMTCSGPFMIRKISYNNYNKGITLERNPYYFRKDKDAPVDKSVNPYKIIIDYTKTPEEQYEMYKNGEIFYVGDIAVSLRGEIDSKVKDIMSTSSIYLNEDAYIGNTVRTFFKESSRGPEEKVDKKVTTITTVHSVYYTYYNYMTQEEYDKKHPEEPYAPISEEDKTEKDFKLYNTRTVEDVKMDGDHKIVNITEYREYRYAIVKGTGADRVTYYSVDVPTGTKLFANKDIRKALSMAIDREAVAKAVVYAKAATGLVPYGVFNSSRKDSFREVGGNYLASGADIEGAKNLIKGTGLNPADFEFMLNVRVEDEAHNIIADLVSKAWQELGFKVIVEKTYPEENDEIGSTGEVSKDIRDDFINEAHIKRNYQAMICDVVSPTVRAFGLLAPFAKDFSGTGMDMNAKDENGKYLYKIEGHITGYNNDAYNEIIERAFAEKDQVKRAEILHEAEKLLMEELPIIPVIFNQRTYLASKDLSKISFSYYGTPIFTKTKLKNYQLYLPKKEG